MTDLAAKIRAGVDAARAGDTAALGNLNSDVFSLMDQLATSTDSKTALMAQQWKTNFEQGARDSSAAVDATHDRSGGQDRQRRAKYATGPGVRQGV
jgi:hypothetical protein